MDFARIARAIARLKLMAFFPSDEDTCLGLAQELSEMCENEEQIEWLCKRVTQLYPKWPGIHELRACLCSRFKPKDGINAYSSQYPEGIPAAPKPKEIAGPEMRALPPGASVSADLRVDAAFELLVSTNRVVNAALSGPVTPEEIAAAPAWLRKLEGYE